MRLSIEKESISSLSQNELLFAIRERRKFIRWHRDQKMDDRCWIDDLGLWEFLKDTPQKSTQLPTFQEGMRLCTDFYVNRSAASPDTTPPNAIQDESKWDSDLPQMSREHLVDELFKIQSIIQTHRDISNRQRTLQDDRALYSILPEKLPADFRLPPKDDFLGEAKAPRAGCPSFWRSHSNCPSNEHDLHRWGPCK